MIFPTVRMCPIAVQYKAMCATTMPVTDWLNNVVVSHSEIARVLQEGKSWFLCPVGGT
jgi:hypothetical protein